MIARVLGEIRADIPEHVQRLRGNLEAFGGWVRACRADIFLALVLGGAMAVYCVLLALRVPPALTDPDLNAWVWFEADPIRVYKSFTSRGPFNYRTSVHPLQTLLIYPPTKALMVLGIPARLAVVSVLATFAGLWAALFFGALRGLTVRRLDAVVFTALAATTAGAVFWFPVTDIYGLNALTLSVTFALGTAVFRYRLGEFVQAIASAASMAATTTNWMAGIILAFVANRYPRAIRVTFDALLIVTLLFAVQKIMDPNSMFFVPLLVSETQFVFNELNGGTMAVLRTLATHSFVVPEIPFVPHDNFPGWIRLRVQNVGLDAFSVPEMLALAVIWLGILGGAVAGLRNPQTAKMAQVLVYYAIFQWLFYMVYGEETFLYALNHVPALVLLAACATTTRFRPVVVSAAAVVTVFLAYNNISEFIRVNDEIARLAVLNQGG